MFLLAAAAAAAEMLVPVLHVRYGLGTRGFGISLVKKIHRKLLRTYVDDTFVLVTLGVYHVMIC